MEICSAYTGKHGGLYIIIYVLSEPEKGLIVSVRAVYSSVPENMWKWAHRIAGLGGPHVKKNTGLCGLQWGLPTLYQCFFCQLVELLWQQKEIIFLPFHKFLFEASMRIEIDKAYFYALPYWALAEKASSTCRCILALVPTLVWEERCMLAISPTLVSEVVVWYH